MNSDILWQILAWLGPAAIFGALVWFFKLPARIWRRFLRWAALKHGKFPRRTMLLAVRRSEWGYGTVGGEPATQVILDVTVTNISAMRVDVIEASFEPTWTVRRFRKAAFMCSPNSFGGHTTSAVVVGGFLMPPAGPVRRWQAQAPPHVSGAEEGGVEEDEGVLGRKAQGEEVGGNLSAFGGV